MSQPQPELTTPSTAPLPNRTRQSASIPRRLISEGKYHLLPVYALLTTSDLAREGIKNSGSFRFADHIYRNEPSGRFGVGRVLDRVLLKLRGARSMRSRFLHSRLEVLEAIEELERGRTVTVVSVPCGIARDLFDVAETLRRSDRERYDNTRFVGIDIDPEPLGLSRELTRGHGRFEFECADALQPGTIPKGVDVIVSLGFGEFLADGTLFDFYRRCLSALRPGGRFITSAMSRDRLSDYLARELAELHTHYRSTQQLSALLTSAGFVTVRTTTDNVGLQTLAVAEKGQ
ncbi:MAG TPA: class I SAM-dependent methyltransferase [Gemmatimonadaceae bacterium]|nr:class I SAM-dependent methyltransferase [Gemmatimonadaceae bacterium]